MTRRLRRRSFPTQLRDVFVALEDLLHALAHRVHPELLVEHVPKLRPENASAPTEVRLEDLTDVHAARNAERIEHDVDRRAVLQVRHVLFGENAGDDALVTVASGHLVADLELPLDGDVDLHHLDDARRQLVALREAIDLVAEVLLAESDDLLELLHLLSKLLGSVDRQIAPVLQGNGLERSLVERTQAKYYKNIEIDLVFRLGLLKFLTQELANQFGNLILEGKEWIRQRGEYFERSQQAHVIKARLSELQSARRKVIRGVGQQVAQMLADVEDNVIAKTRRALFGDDFAPLYELLKNRLIFLDGGKDDVFFLEHYVLLGNYARDPDRFEAMDALFQEFICEAGLTIGQDPAFTEANQAHNALLEQAAAMRSGNRQSGRTARALRKKLDRGESFFNKFLNFRGSLGFESFAERHRDAAEAPGIQTRRDGTANRRREAEAGFF